MLGRKQNAFCPCLDELPELVSSDFEQDDNEGEGEDQVPSDLDWPGAADSGDEYVPRVACKKRQTFPSVTTYAQYTTLVQQGLLDESEFDDKMESPVLRQLAEHHWNATAGEVLHAWLNVYGVWRREYKVTER